jgi:hypothetical protein
VSGVDHVGPGGGFTERDEGPHAGCVDEWVVGAWTADGSVGVLTGQRTHPDRRRIGYWWVLVRADGPLLLVTDWSVPMRADPLLVKGEQLWAEMTCEAPFEQWTIGNETYAAALDDPQDALGRAHGAPTPVAIDLEWYATGDVEAIVDGYRQDGVVHGIVEVAGEASVALTEVPAMRWHRWAPVPDPPPPLDLPLAMAHTGRRAPVLFPEGTVLDAVLLPGGWHRRTG